MNSEPGKWTKVSERLPEIETEVLTYDGITVRGQFFGTDRGRYPKGKFLPTWYKPFEWMYPTDNEVAK